MQLGAESARLRADLKHAELSAEAPRAEALRLRQQIGQLAAENGEEREILADKVPGPEYGSDAYQMHVRCMSDARHMTRCLSLCVGGLI